MDQIASGKYSPEILVYPVYQPKMYQALESASSSLLGKLLMTLAANGPPGHGLDEEEDVIQWVARILFAGMHFQTTSFTIDYHIDNINQRGLIP